MSSGRGQLHIASASRLPAEEYRIRDGKVEVADLRPGQYGSRVWRSLTPAQLSFHVEHNTCVAQWLERRIGWRNLLWACLGVESPFSVQPPVENFRNHQFPSL